MESWVAWLIIAVALGAAELLTGTLAPGLTAVAAAAAAATGAVSFGLAAQIAAFAVAAAICPGLVRPVVLHHIRPRRRLRSGMSALIGWSAVVCRSSARRAGGSASPIRSGPPAPTTGTWLSPQAIVDVIEIDGAMALVYPRE